MLSWLVRKTEHEPRQHSRRLNFDPRCAGKVPRANRPARRSATVTNKMTLGFARKEQHDCGLSRDLLAMTSHNRCTTQRRLVLPLSASGGLRQGRFPALRSGAICCIELYDVMPSPKRGQVPRQAAKYPAVRSGHERHCIVACRERCQSHNIDYLNSLAA